jgi:tetratricopeptide (TPR) repeat protein
MLQKTQPLSTMTSKITLVASLLWWATVVAGQAGRPDSLLNALAALPVNTDTATENTRLQLMSKIGNWYYRNANYPVSRTYYQQLLTLELRRNDRRGIAQNLNNIGFTYLVESRYPEALDTFLLAFDQWENLRDTGKMAQLATGISNLYHEFGNQKPKELEYARRCMELSERARRWHGLCACTHLVGDIFDQMGQNDSATWYVQRSVTLLEQQPDIPGLVTLYLSMSRYAARRQHYSEELKWLQKAAQNQQKYAPNITEIERANLLLSLGNCYLHLGDNAAAARYLREVERDLIPHIPDWTYHDRLYEHLSRLAERQGQPEAALRYFKMHIAARDSVLNMDDTRRITQIQLTHEFEKKRAETQAVQDRELAVQEAQSRQQRWVFAALLLGLATAAGAGFYVYRQRQERRRTELELANLRAQINPHFIFNCLNSIYRYTKERDTDTAGKYLQKFSSLLRLVLENSRSEKITLARDLEALQLYADIEGLRFKEKLRFSLDIDPEIDPGFVQIPGMLIQPHVENAIWHGLMHRSEGGHISVRIEQPTETLLRITVEDDGVGRAAAAELESKSAQQKKSLGQKITEERLRSTGKLASTTTTDLFDADGNAVGTRVVMEIVL